MPSLGATKYIYSRSFGGPRRFLWIGSLDGACQKLAAEGDGGEWCPVHGYGGSNFSGLVERTPWRTRAPAEEGRAEYCCWIDSGVFSLLASLYMWEGGREGHRRSEGRGRAHPLVNRPTPSEQLLSIGRPFGTVAVNRPTPSEQLLSIGRPSRKKCLSRGTSHWVDPP